MPTDCLLLCALFSETDSGWVLGLGNQSMRTLTSGLSWVNPYQQWLSGSIICRPKMSEVQISDPSVSLETWQFVTWLVIILDLLRPHVILCFKVMVAGLPLSCS